MQIQKTVGLIFLLAFSLSNLYATTYTFNGSGSYSDVNNWEGKEYPGTSISADDVVIIDEQAVCIVNSAITLYGEFHNHGEIQLNKFFTNLGEFINESTGYFSMSSSSSFRNHFFFYNRAGAKFSAANTFYNYYKFYNNAAASFVNQDYFFSFFQINNNGYFENLGVVNNFDVFSNYGTGSILNLGDFNNDDTFQNFGIVNNRKNFANRIGGEVINGGKFMNRIGATFDIQQSSKFSNNADVLNEIGAKIIRADQTIFTNNGMFNGTGLFVGNLIADNNSTLQPNTETTVGSYHVDGNYSQSSTATYQVEIQTGTQYDILNISETATLDGTLDIKLLGGFLPIYDGQEFVLINYGNSVGNFSTVNFPDISGTGLAWNLVYEATELILVASAALPVELISFKAELVRNDVQLDWTTATEINNDFFAVEYSSNGRDFEEIGTVQGNGNSYDLNDYSFIHRNATSGKNYYRLRQVDIGGIFEISKTAVVTISDNSELPIAYPNPVTAGSNSVTLPGLTKGIATVRVFDNLGQLINQFELGTQAIEIPTQGLNSGAYQIEINRGGNISTQRIIVL